MAKPTHERDWNFLGDGDSVRHKNFKKCVKIYCNFQRDGRGGGKVLSKKNPSVGEVWITSETTQFEQF